VKYALLLYDNPANWANVDDDRMKSLHAGYMAVSDAPESYGGAQLQPAEAGKTVRANGGGELLVTDGPFAETKEVISGFYLIDADTEARALELAKQIPTVSQMGGAIEVRPIVER
jgi:hypothetical protein